MSPVASRSDISARASTAEGLLFAPPSARQAVGLKPDELEQAISYGTDVLAGCGIDGGSRVVVTLNDHGELNALVSALALSRLARSAASLGPRGRLGIAYAIQNLRADTWVTTPCGALDLLARVHGEHGLDPAELGLSRIVVMGEILEARRFRQVAYEFECDVVVAIADPLFSVPVASGTAEKALVGTEDDLAVMSLTTEAAVEDGLGELVVTPRWLEGGDRLAYRTGLVVSVSPEGGFSAPVHTVGEEVILRGRWLNEPALADALRVVDGIQSWSLVVSRPGTLDTAKLICRMSRSSLVGNEMWRQRIVQMVRTVTPAHVEVDLVGEEDEVGLPGGIVDLRGQHLGSDRAAADKTLSLAART